MHENDPEFHRKIILSDEAHFHFGGFVNKQNYRIWGSANPRVEKPHYPQRVTGTIYGPAGVIGPIFFENEAGATITANGLRYREIMIFYGRNWTVLIWTTFTFNKTCHTSNETIGLLREKFPGRVIS